jgi:K+-transporting ATPase ATPase B chain
MIALVEGAKRQKTPNEIALIILLSGLTIIFLLVVVALPAYFGYSLKASGVSANHNLTLPVLISLLVCLIPTTIGGLLSAIGISGMDRLLRKNVIATSGKAIEAAGDTDVLLLDKTGTITLGNRMATEFIPADGITKEQLADAAQLASLADETPEGRSIVVLAKEQFNIRAREMQTLDSVFIPFTAQTSMSVTAWHGLEGMKFFERNHGNMGLWEGWTKVVSSVLKHGYSTVKDNARIGN